MTTKQSGKEIKKGDMIIIDRGFRTYTGRFLKVLGFSAFGFWGEYEDSLGNIRLWDESCDKLIKI